MRLHCFFTQCLSFLLSFFLSIEWIWNDSWMISSHNDHDVSRRQSEHIIMLQRVYKWPIYKTCSHIHYLLILSFTLILVAVTRNKIVTNEACSALFDCCFFFFKPYFLKYGLTPWNFIPWYNAIFYILKDHVSVNSIFIRKVVQRASQIQTYVNLVIKWYYFSKPRGKIKIYKTVFFLNNKRKNTWRNQFIPCDFNIYSIVKLYKFDIVSKKSISNYYQIKLVNVLKCFWF